MREPLISKDTALADLLNALFLRRVWREPAPAEPNAESSETEHNGRCDECGNYAEGRYCSICTNPLRSRGILMVVRDPKDIRAEEEDGVFWGLYHVLPSTSAASGQWSVSDSLQKLRDRVLRFKPVKVFVVSAGGDDRLGEVRGVLQFDDVEVANIEGLPGKVWAAFLDGGSIPEGTVTWMGPEDIDQEQRTGPDDRYTGKPDDERK